MSYYLKYRPQTIGDLDLIKVRQTLQKWLLAKELAHAYLFAGPKGTGKTSAARIMAKVLNCESNREVLAERMKSQSTPSKLPLVEPCGTCEGCVSVQKGTSLAVLEIDAASNRGIDDIRQLRDRISLAPASGLYTVYVIDEVHMLTTEAFNALLKTLEEPPKHAVFVLCTTELHKVPDTVASRCLVVSFSNATGKEIQTSLQKAILGEDLDVKEKAIELIARRSRGSFRDGMKLLEQAAYGDKAITVERVNEITDHESLYEVDELLRTVKAMNAGGVMELMTQKETAGVDFSLLGERLVEELRERLKQAVIGETVNDDWPAEQVVELLQVVQEAVPLVKYAPVPAVPLELALVSWCLKSDRIVTKEPQVDHKVTRSVDDSKIKSKIKAQTVTTISESQEKTSIKSDKKMKKASSQAKDDPLEMEEILGKWGQVMKELKPLNHSIEALLRSARPADSSGQWLTIEVFYTFHKEQLEQERHRRIVEGVLGKVMDRPVKVKFVLGKKASRAKQKAPEVINVTGELLDEELAQAAEEIFG